MYDAGEFKNIDPHFKGPCVVHGVHGSEDITILSDHRWLTLAGTPVQGGIFSFDLNDPSPQPVNLTRDLDLNFIRMG